MDFSKVTEAVQAAGLTVRGGFHPGPDDLVPVSAEGGSTATLILLGNAGPAMWQAFTAARDSNTDRLDDWSREVIGGLAERLGAAALFPFTRPYLPFQRWAQKAEACHPSPLGMFIHPDFGLWHGFRGALVFDRWFELPAPDLRPSPCDNCSDRPCLATCPVAAFSAQGYDVPACAAHLADQGGVDCMELGCRARLACPAGRDFRYQPAQAAFHMRAFLAARRPC